jgi:Domain of unknown function (DUF4157)
MSDLQSTIAKKRQNSDSTFKVSPFQSRGFGVQEKSEESSPATKAELWQSYQQAKNLNQKGANPALAPILPIQAKLTVGKPGDKYEQEADSMAAQVMAMPESGQIQREELSEEEEEVQMKPLGVTISPLVPREALPEEEEEIQMKPLGATISPLVQREALPEEEIQAKPLGATISPLVQRESLPEEDEIQMKPCDNGIQRELAPEEEEEPELQMKPLGNSIQREPLPEVEEEIQTKQLPDANSQAPTSSLESSLSSSKGGGNPLSENVRSFMEPRFGADFSGVRVHTDSAAVQMNQSVNAQAFAHGQDIYFGAGKSPGNNDLTAHELTHTIQQTGGLQKRSLGKQIRKGNKIQAKLESSQPTIQRKENPPQADSSSGGQSATSAANDSSFGAVAERTKHSAKEQKEHPPAGAKAAEAQSAATSPTSEIESKAQDRQVQEMNQQQPGEFNAAKFKAALIKKIGAAVPENLEQADKFKNQNKLDSIKGDLSTQVKSEKQQAAGNVEEKAKEQPNTAGIPPKPVTPIPAPQPGAPPSDVGAADAAPKPKTAAEVSLQEGSQALEQQMTDASVTEEQLANSNEPGFQSALTAKKSSQTNADTAPVAYRQQEGAIVTQAQATAQATAQTQLQGMHGDKQNVLSTVLGQQGQAKEQDEGKRTGVASDIQKIYTDTKQKVETVLNGLDSQVTTLFEQGAVTAKSIFTNYADQEMSVYKDKRYSGADGKVLWATDLLSITHLPDEVNKFYQEGKRRYLESMDKTIDGVSELVAKKLNEAKAAIANGKQEIQQYVAKLDPSLKEVGKEAAQNIQSKFDELADSINNKQSELVDNLAQKYQESLKGIDARIEEMKKENSGLLERAKAEMDGVIKTVIELKNMLMSTLAKAGSAIDLIIKDPIKFLDNLAAGIKQGFMNFAGNIVEHLKKGLLGWLTGALGDAGIQMPENFDLKGIFSLVMQVLGLTYANIRGRAADKLGEKVVSTLEAGFEWFVILKEQGLAGLWEHVKEKIGDLKTMVLDNIQNFVIESVVKAGVTWVISLLNPASAFIKACKSIYDIVMFFIERGSQIMELVNAVLDSVTAIANGSIGSAATFIENALSKALPVVISFMASLLGLGGISEKIQSIVKKIQEPINKAIDWVIGKGAKAFKTIGNKFKNSKFGKKVIAVKDGAKEKYKAGKQWVEDKKEAGKQWVDDKKQSVKDKLGFGKEAKSSKIEGKEHEQKVQAGLAAINLYEQSYLKDGKISQVNAKKVAVKVKINHSIFKSITVVSGNDTWDYEYVASPKERKIGKRQQNKISATPDDFPKHEKRSKTAESFKVLENGKIRYYDPIRLAQTEGPSLGGRLVKEVDMDGKVRSWYETIDKETNKPRQIRVEQDDASGIKVKKHYLKDPKTGKVTGVWSSIYDTETNTWVKALYDKSLGKWKRE